MATVVTTTYSTAGAGGTTITMDLSALASSATFVAGRESNEVDNTSNKYMDALVQGRFQVGTTPTLPCQLNVYVWGADTSLATTAIATVLDGADSNETVTTTDLGFTLALAQFCPILVNTSNIIYDLRPFSVAPFFGGVLPKFWGLFVAHNMAAALKTDANNTNSFRFNGITYTNT